MQTRIWNILLFLLLTGLISCHVYRNTSSSLTGENKAEEVPRILFLDYQISRDTLNESFNVQLINMLVVNGKIKERPVARHQAGQGDLELQVLNSQQQIITHQYIANPLDRSVEYPNDNGQFERRMVHLDSAQFNVRLQLGPNACSIVIKRFIDENEGTLLLQTPIQ